MLKKINYTWVMIVLSFLMVGCSLGFCSSPGSLYITAITDALGIARSAYSVTYSLRFVSTAVVNLFFGALIARFGPKKLICAGFVSLITANLIFSFASTIPLFYLGSIFLGLGFSWTSTTMAGYIINLWCVKNKGTMMGAVLASNGVFGAIAMQLVTYFMYRNDDPFGYRDAYRVVALLLVILAVLVIIFFKNDPPEPSTVTTQGKKSRGRQWEGIAFSDALKRVFFWVTLVAIFLTGFTLQGVYDIAAPHMKDIGVDPVYVATVLSVNSLCLTAFKLLTGFLYDKCGLRITSGMCYIVAAIVFLVLSAVSPTPTGKVLAMIYGVFSAFALPLETVMIPIFAGDLFGEKSFSKILGILVSVNSAGYALGSPVSNLCYDITGSYNVFLYFCSALIIIVAIAMQFIISHSNKIEKQQKNQGSL